MKSIPKLLSGLAIVATVTTGLGVAGSGAQNADLSSEKSERRQEIRQAIENNDYETFSRLAAERGAGNITEKITEENFPRFVEFHNAVKEKDFETAKEIKEELGLKGHPKRKKGEHREGHLQFVVENDYEVFKAKAEEKGKTDILETITADNYAIFQEFAQAALDQDREKAEELREELGLPEKKERKGRKKHNHKEVMAFVTQNDYAAFAAKATEEGKDKILEVVTADNYEKFQELAQAVLDGDRETAEKIREELGLPEHKHRGHHGKDRSERFGEDDHEDDHEDDDDRGQRGRRGPGRGFGGRR